MQLKLTLRTGCTVNELVEAIRHKLTAKPKSIDETEGEEAEVPLDEHQTDFKAVAAIWQWLFSRQDVSLGQEQKYNHLTLSEVLACSTVHQGPEETGGHDGSTGEAAEVPGKPSKVRGQNRHFPDDMKAIVTTETMWECLTGHGVDYGRVPKSEWELLQGVASTMDKGILQGNLCRLTGQDKRSVPKRTDSLARKGYVIKRTVLVRGTKTSNIWLNRFVPPYLEQKEKKEQHTSAGMILDHEFLRENRDAVPWHERWTGDRVDYVALATTIAAVVKSWGVIRVSDLKLKLGVTDLVWHMKVASKTLRLMHARGVMQFVGARLDGKLFKDCLKYVRDMDDFDWEAYLAVGKRGSEDARDLLDSNITIDPLLLAARPPWSLDEPLHTYLARVARSMAGSQLSNADMFSLSMGTAFTRFLTTTVSSMAESAVQPLRLKHYQLQSEHTRIGKVASYRYWIPPTASHVGDQDTESQPYGFSALPAKSGMQTDTADLSVICKPSRHVSKPTRGTYKLERVLGPTHSVVADQPSDEVLQERQDPDQQLGDIKCGGASPRSMATLPNESKQTSAPEKAGSLAPASMALGEGTVAQEHQTDGVSFETEQQRLPKSSETATHGRSSPLYSAVAPVSEDVEMVEAGPAISEAALITPIETTSGGPQDIHDDFQPPSSRGRGARGSRGGRGTRGRGGSGRGRGKGRGGASSTEGKPWKCEKCGGAWKNDIGLKYHLEKAKVPCNPSFDPGAPVLKRGKARALASSLEASMKATMSSSQGDEPTKGSDLDVNAPGLKEVEGVEHGSASEDDENVASRSRREKRRANCSQQVSSSRRLKPIRMPQTGFDPPKSNKRSALLPSTVLQTIRAADIIDTSTGSTALSPISQTADKDDHVDPRLASNSIATQQKESHDPRDLPKRETDTVYNGFKNKTTESPSSALAGKGLSQTALHRENKRRVEVLLRSILAENRGCFPGGDALWRALRVAWVQDSSDDNCPTNRAFKGIVAALIRSNFVAEHCHAFRAPNGSFANVKIMSFPDEDPFSPKARELLVKVKAAYPDIWLPEYIRKAETASLQVNGEIVKSKRALPNELVELDAPVYVEQIAAKRKLREDQSRRGGSKRRKYGLDTVDERRGKRGGIAGVYRFRTSSARHTPVDVQRMANFSQNTKLRFLDPNTDLDDVDLKLGGSTKMSRAEQRRASIKPQLFDRYGLHQQSHITVEKSHSEDAQVIPPYSISSSKTGAWPNLDLQFFEDCGGSFTLESQDWFPTPDWFSWCGINQAIDKTTSAQASRGWFRVNEPDNRSRRFKDRLVAAARVEMAWGDTFLVARPGAAGPHNIFIHFWGPPVPDTGQVGVYSWPDKGQYTLEHPVPVPKESENDQSSEDDSEFEEAVSIRLRRRKVYSRGSRKKMNYQRRQQRPAPTKSVELKRRRMTAIPEGVATQTGYSWGTWDTPAPNNPEELLAGIIAVRSLMGGIDRHVDWGFLLHLFPEHSFEVIRKFWKQARKSQKSYIMQLTHSFQEEYVAACEAGELPILDFDNPTAYDWDELIKWTMQVPSRPDTQIPSTVEELDDRFTLQDVASSNENWRERFFHFQTSAHARLELSTADPAALCIDKPHEEATIDIDEVSRSWIRSLCCTGEADYAPEAIKDKLRTLAEGDVTKVHALLEKAIGQLTADKVIHSKRGAGVFDSKPHRLVEAYVANLGRLAHWENYKQAAEFKTQLDNAFRAGQTFRIPRTISDGAMMALLNLNAYGRIALKGVDVPNIPFGFHPGKYESRKFDKKLYHFDLEVLPTAIYQFNEDIPAVARVRSAEPPTEGPGGALPQWVDFFGRYDINRWVEIVAAVCFAYSTRGHMPTAALLQHMRPILEDFEANLLTEWGRKVGVLEEGTHCTLTVGEWWWLAVPAMKQHLAF